MSLALEFDDRLIFIGFSLFAFGKKAEKSLKNIFCGSANSLEMARTTMCVRAFQEITSFKRGKSYSTRCVTVEAEDYVARLAQLCSQSEANRFETF